LDDQDSVVVDLNGMEFNSDLGVIFESSDGSSDLNVDSFGINSDGLLEVNIQDGNFVINGDLDS
jgi:hypothetical protein